MTPADARLFRQYGPRLARPGSFLAKDTAGDFGLYVARNKAQKPLAQIEASVVRKWLHSDLLEVDSTADTGHYMISSAGRAFLRRAAQAAGTDEAFIAQHQIRKTGAHKDAPSAKMNVAQTPLAWLRNRKPNKRFGISEIEFDAGEKLLKVYDRTGFRAITGIDWSRPICDGGHGGDGGGADAALAEAIDARRKLQGALDYVGPGLAEMLVSICCEARGLEECERLFALPQRSAKLMLKLGLMRLSVFYGLQSASAASASFRMR